MTEDWIGKKFRRLRLIGGRISKEIKRPFVSLTIKGLRVPLCRRRQYAAVNLVLIEKIRLLINWIKPGGFLACRRQILWPQQIRIEWEGRSRVAFQP